MSTPSSPSDPAPPQWLVLACVQCHQPTKVRMEHLHSRLHCPHCHAELPTLPAPTGAGAEESLRTAGVDAPQRPLISQGNPDAKGALPVEIDIDAGLAQDRLDGVYRSTADAEFAIPPEGITVRKRKKRRVSQQKEEKWDRDEEEVEDDEDEDEEGTRTDTEVVEVLTLEDGSTVEKRRRTKKKRQPTKLDRFWKRMGAVAAWSLLALGVALVAGLVYAGLRAYRGRHTPPAALSQEEINGLFGRAKGPGYVPAAELKTALDTVRNFLAASGAAGKAGYVRHPERVRPLMEAWYATRDAGPKTFTRPENVELLNQKEIVGELTFITVAVMVQPEDKAQFFCLELEPEGTARVDWQISSGWQPMDFSEFQTKKPVDPVAFRVKMREPEDGDYYNKDFKNEEEWLCVELYYPGQPDFRLFGYVERNGPLGAEVAKRFAEGERFPVVAELSWPESHTSENQVKVGRVLRWSWYED